MARRFMKIFFVHQELRSFVKKDLDILREKHEVRTLQFVSRKYFDLIPSMWKLLCGIAWCDISFSWFGKLHAFFAVIFSKLLGKRSIVVAGGDDVAAMPEIDYGLCCKWWKGWCPLFLFKLADAIIAVSEYTKKEAMRNTGIVDQKIPIVYHGFSRDHFRRFENIKKESMVITVSQIFTESNIRKGLETFVRSARYLPGVQFYLVGRAFPLEDRTIDFLKKIASDNVVFTGEVSDDELIKLFNRARVYVQLSLHEGFGCAIAEAMLCGCVPVVSRSGAIPEVVGNTGVYVDELTPENSAEKIKYALSLPDDNGEKARYRIIEKFPLERRKEQILELIERLS
jgi:glycosyltransferase involved in cell wall biosynthesis